MFETSADVAELFKALIAFQGECQGPKKTSTNPHFKSKYADLETVVETLMPVMQKHGLGYTQFPCSEGDSVGVTTMVFHSSGQWMRSSYVVPLQKKDAQTAVAAVTYCRRTSLMAAAGLSAEDDDGNTASQKPEPRRDVPQQSPSSATRYTAKEGEQRHSPTSAASAVTRKESVATVATHSSSIDDDPVDDAQRDEIKSLFKKLGVQGPGLAEAIKKHTGKAPAEIKFSDANKLIAALDKEVRLNTARAAQAAGEAKP